MKRLKFKKPFNGMDNALKLIPESYKVDGKEFEITDGVETYRVKWSTSLNEATVLMSSNKNLINEDMQKMKHLMGFKSEETLGIVKGAARLDENKKFGDVLNKTKKLISESEEKESINEAEGPKHLKSGMGGSNKGKSRTDKTEVLKDKSKKQRRQDDKAASKNIHEEYEDGDIPSQAKIGQEFKSKGASINDANFNAKERGIVGRLLNIIDNLSQESNGFSSQVFAKLEALTSAVDNALAKNAPAEDSEGEGAFNENKMQEWKEEPDFIDKLVKKGEGLSVHEEEDGELPPPPPEDYLDNQVFEGPQVEEVPCGKCKGKGCDHCSGMGVHMLPIELEPDAGVEYGVSGYEDLDEGGVCHECGDEEMDRFDEIFEGMYEEEGEESSIKPFDMQAIDDYSILHNELVVEFYVSPEDGYSYFIIANWSGSGNSWFDKGDRWTPDNWGVDNIKVNIDIDNLFFARGSEDLSVYDLKKYEYSDNKYGDEDKLKTLMNSLEPIEGVEFDKKTFLSEFEPILEEYIKDNIEDYEDYDEPDWSDPDVRSQYGKQFRNKY